MVSLATMTVWDVQLGLAIHVKAPNGKYIVIDLGTGTYESGNISPLAKRRYDNIAYMILTHPHLDHIDDILNFDLNSPKILHRAKALGNDEVMKDVRYCDKAKFEKYCEINNRYNSPVTPQNENYTGNLDNYGGLGIQTFSTSVCDHSNFNNFSTITVFTLSMIKIVVCGDNETESLDVLMRQRDFKSAVENADVLVAPHHGRESAYHSDFVSLVNPRITIISDTAKTNASASDKYTHNSRGFKVDGATRYCLTTRKDGNIDVVFGESDNSNYYGTLYITTSK
ncbi:MBL fold metallo-hydrolase [uncultured Rikenella sp.]|uniref:ComEC/Rec2 family competence protein n=1 Tax=uncultured Rikenella sp. TaxID=368003 RepID=UPI002606A5F9|nr:MBL fold metallo-hydrolase [uncultured Rikenella sp.]